MTFAIPRLAAYQIGPARRRTSRIRISRECRNRGKGTLPAHRHLGRLGTRWYGLAAAGLPVSVVTLEEPYARLDVCAKSIAQFRHQNNHGRLDKFAFLEIMQPSDETSWADVGRSTLFEQRVFEVKFFDQPTLFSAAAARIWHKHRCDYHSGICSAASTGTIRMLRLSSDRDDHGTGPEENSQRVADVFQAIIREFPDQWFNFVPIWKH